jgi:hypothetical protein
MLDADLLAALAGIAGVFVGSAHSSAPATPTRSSVRRVWCYLRTVAEAGMFFTDTPVDRWPLADDPAGATLIAWPLPSGASAEEGTNA